MSETLTDRAGEDKERDDFLEWEDRRGFAFMKDDNRGHGLSARKDLMDKNRGRYNGRPVAVLITDCALCDRCGFDNLA